MGVNITEMQVIAQQILEMLLSTMNNNASQNYPNIEDEER